MKKLFLLFAAGLIIASSVCVDAKNRKQSAGSKKNAIVNAINKKPTNTTTAEVVSKGDVALFDLKGPVKYVRMDGLEDCGYVPEYTFDRNGKVTNYDRPVELDKNGFITQGFLPGDCNIGDMWADKIVRNANGLVTKIVWQSSTGGHEITQVIKYDANLNATGSTVTTTWNRDIDKITYKNLEVDKYGNWTKREEILDGQKRINERTIQYYTD